MRKFLLIATFLASFILSGAMAEPSKELYVNDLAKRLSLDHSMFVLQNSRKLYDETGVQLMVLTVNELSSRETAEDSTSAEKSNPKGSVYMFLFFLVALMISYRALAINRKHHKRHSENDNYYKRRSFVAERRAFDEDEENAIIEISDKKDNEG